MATSPQYGSTVNKGTPGSLTAANTTKDGTGATGRQLVFTAGASGGVLPRIRYKHKGTNVATLMRVFRNNGSDPETASNNILVAETAIAAWTNSEIAESPIYESDFAAMFDCAGMFLAAGERVYVTLATAVAAGIAIAPVNGADL